MCMLYKSSTANKSIFKNKENIIIGNDKIPIPILIRYNLIYKTSISVYFGYNYEKANILTNRRNEQSTSCCHSFFFDCYCSAQKYRGSQTVLVLTAWSFSLSHLV